MSTDEWRPREYRKSDLMRNNDAAFSTSSATPTYSRDNRESRDPQDSHDKAQGEAYEAFGRKQRAMQRKLGKAYRPREAKDTSKRDVAWKALIQKLDETKSDKERFGKDTEQYQSVRNQKNVPDELKCVHFEECSGCSLRGKFDDSPVIRRASAYFKSESIPFRVNMGQTTAWRTHVKLAVQPTSRWGGVKMGLYKEGTHIVEAIPECRVHHPRINEAVAVLEVASKKLSIKGYRPSEKGKDPEGDLRYVQMSVDPNSEYDQKVQVVLVWNAANFKDAGALLPKLVKLLRQRSDLFHSISVNFQTAQTNTIFNYNEKSWKLLWGPPVMKQIVGRASFFFKPQIFRQANLGAFASMIIPLVRKHVKEGSKVAELYSGIGIMGLNIADRASEVLCSDSNTHVSEVFDSGVETLPEADQEKLFYDALSAEDAITAGQCDEAEVILVDPPRKGLDKGVMNLLLGIHPEKQHSSTLSKLIYVSCGYEALERNCRELLASNRWEVVEAQGFVLFPGSDHVESVVVFERINAAAARSTSGSA
jgi:tRNA/tmRNA/rRNA uracil-C5-methylase (TrmA/RlmC/RlmD family)